MLMLDGIKFEDDNLKQKMWSSMHSDFKKLSKTNEDKQNRYFSIQINNIKFR